MSYTPTTWQTGDTITAEKLNNMESGIEASNGIIIPITVDADNERYYVPKEIAGDVYNQLVANPDAPVFLSFTNSSFATPFFTSAAEKFDLGFVAAYAASFDVFAWESFARFFTHNPQNYIGAKFVISKSAYESGYDWVGGLISQAFIVTLTPTAQDYSGTMDKTVGEINAAYEAGQKIVFKVMENATDYMMVDCSAQYFDGHVYPSFNAYIIMPGVGIVFAATGTRDNETWNGYVTTIYPLTPMS